MVGLQCKTQLNHLAWHRKSGIQYLSETPAIDDNRTTVVNHQLNVHLTFGTPIDPSISIIDLLISIESLICSIFQHKISFVTVSINCCYLIQHNHANKNKTLLLSPECTYIWLRYVFVVSKIMGSAFTWYSGIFTTIGGSYIPVIYVTIYNCLVTCLSCIYFLSIA